LETKALEITLRDKETLMQALMQTSEYVSSFQNNKRFQIMVLMP
jgi:hypothetical protein